jgi:hypothetical protein
MAERISTTDVTNLPDALQIAQEVKTTKQPQVLSCYGEEIAVVWPLPQPATRSRKGRAFTKDDPLFKLIGIGKSGIPGGVSGHKHEFLAKAARHE